MIRTTDLTGLNPQNFIYPKTLAVITAAAGGRQNAMTAAWYTTMSAAPPLVGVAIHPRRYTYELILDSGEFGVAFLPLESAHLYAALGASRGREMDKLAHFKVALDSPLKTKAPILSAAYASYECTVRDHQRYGSHEWFVGEIVALHIKDDLLTPSRILDLEKVSPALYLGGDTYLTPDGKTARHLDRRQFQPPTEAPATPRASS
ncbi:MAG: flavin reductase family protein [Chloroflexi bacterium]|nr:flavin reductase family protein [Chloroflexota bacterium]